jgi:hypothetical protein
MAECTGASTALTSRSSRRWTSQNAVEFNWEAAYRNIQAVRPGMEVLKVSTKTEEGMESFVEYLKQASARTAAAV